jgi:hypothetical protein
MFRWLQQLYRSGQRVWVTLQLRSMMSTAAGLQTYLSINQRPRHRPAVNVKVPMSRAKLRITSSSTIAKVRHRQT